MNLLDTLVSRRSWLRGSLGLGAVALFTPGVFAEQLARTPAMTEGPFYPDRLPLDSDNDLVIVNNSITPAVGAITHLSGRVLDMNASTRARCGRRDLASRQQRRLSPLRR